MGNLKVFSLAGTSSLVIGKGYYEDLSSHSKTTNGVGSAYGDGSYINMSPYQSPVNDPDIPYKSYNPYYYQPYYSTQQGHYGMQGAPHYYNPYVVNNYLPRPPGNYC
ncbi:hypothetical protein [Bacillus mesophilus]|uniref:hypothetical protein n=1 Tax=Bacillus mesophilus TaxID=1808955 RepID=UPI0030B7F7DF